MAELIYTQDSFDGGMDLRTPDSKLAANQYRLGFNFRNRNGRLEPIKSPLDITTGLGTITQIQGLYAFGDILVCFRDGLAYYRNLTTETWTQVSGFLMSSVVDRIYCCPVPQSTIDYQRENNGTTPDVGVSFNSTTVTGTPVCLVVQDGVNQPFLIFPDGTCRAALTYAQWVAATNREYVPIGRQMCYFNGILFVVSADGKYIYRSVSGRPLDFVVAVDNAANKVADAEVTSFAVDSNEIRVLATLNADSLIVITSYAAYVVSLDDSFLLYGEPRFNQQLLFTAGACNQFCFTDILGDFALIDREGLKSFNAVLQLRNEGNNAVFSLSVADLFTGVVQDNPCVGSFDNYTFFSVKTTHAVSGVLVFDNLSKRFVCLDTMTPEAIRQFASTYTSDNQQFFAATRHKVYELYPRNGETFQESVLFTRAFKSSNTDLGPTPRISQIRTSAVQLIFKSSEEEGIVNFNQLVDEKYDTVDLTKDLEPLENVGVRYPVGAPVLATINNAINNIQWKPEGLLGNRISYVFLWTGGHILQEMQFIMTSKLETVNAQQQGRG